MLAPFLEMGGKNRALGGQSYSNKYFQTKIVNKRCQKLCTTSQFKDSARQIQDEQF